MESIKSKVILLKRGGRIWASDKQAEVASEAKLAGEGVVDIDGQLIEVTEIRAIVDSSTYQTTSESVVDRNRQANLPPSRTVCGICGGYGFRENKSERIYSGVDYGHSASPCPQCNPNPPEFRYA